jgi:hypothetical protein
VAFFLIRPESQIPNIRHDGTLSIGNFMLMMKKPKNLELEPLHPKNVLLASGISCLFYFCLFDMEWPFSQSTLKNTNFMIFKPLNLFLKTAFTSISSHFIPLQCSLEKCEILLKWSYYKEVLRFNWKTVVRCPFRYVGSLEWPRSEDSS